MDLGDDDGDVVAAAGCEGVIHHGTGDGVEIVVGFDRRSKLVVGDFAPEAVAALQQSVTGRDCVDCLIDVDAGTDAERTSEDGALRMIDGLVCAQPALPNEFFGERMVGRQLLERSVSQPVATAVTHVDHRELTGVREPNRAASLAVARTKNSAEHVRWVLAEASAIPESSADLATMTGNVAQVFLDDAEWSTVLGSIRHALRPGGYLVFEAREPSRCAWEEWTAHATFEAVDHTAEGRVEHWVELTEVALPFVSFRHYYVFEDDRTQLASDSTLRFRSREEIELSLTANGFTVLEIRDAPDRPGRENVFVARSNP